MDPLNSQAFGFTQNTDPNAVSAYKPLQGTMTGTMTKPATPPTPQTAQVPPSPTSQTSSPFALADVMTSLESKIKSNNALMTQRNLLLKHLYDQPLTDAEKAQLDPSFVSSLGDRNQVDMNLRLISDEIQGRTGTLDQSVKYLLDAHEKEQAQIEQKRKDAVTTVYDFARTYKGNAGAALKALYGQEYMDQLKSYGIDINKLSTIGVPGSGVGGSGLTTVGGSGVVAGVKVPKSIAGDVEDVLSGRNTLYNIRQTMGRTNAAAAYMQSMRNAIHSIDPTFDFIASDAGGKFVSSEYYQKSSAAINSVMPNIDKVVDLSNQVQRVGIASVDSLLQKGQVQIGNTKVASFRQAQKLIADEIGLALGQGTVSDMKLQLGFDVTDPSVSQEVFASNMEIVKEFIQNRLKGLQEQRYSSDTVGGSTSDLASQVKAKGYDYAKLRQDYSDEQIRQALGI